jgi:drug/metabolite transporter (DMT)-like permease
LDHPPKPTSVPASAPRDGRIWLGLLTLYFVWGSTYLGIAFAVETIPPFLMAGVRFLTAGLILLAWSMAREGRAFVPPTRREWRDSAVVGTLLIGGGMGLVAFGEQTVPSGITALLIAMMPVWVAVLGRIFLGEGLPRLAVVGIVVGFAGVALLVGPSAFGGQGALDPLGLAVILVSPISWAIGSLFASHRAELPRRPLVATGAQMLIGGSLLLVAAVATGELGQFKVDAVSRDSFIALVYLTTIGSLLAFTTFGWMLRVAPLPFVSTYAYVNPVIAVILGFLIAGEVIEPRTVVAGAIIVAAVAMIVTARGRMQAPRSARPDPDDAGDAAVTVPVTTTVRAPTR